MATLLADSFTRTGATLGTGWTEQSGDFSTDGSKAQIDATGLSIATADATSQTDQFVQCWCRVPNASQNSGVLWRYQSATLFYMVVGLTTSFAFFRRDGGGYNAIGTYSASGLGTNTWRRVGIRMVGSQIDFYLDNNYNATLEGPAFRVTDANITGAGLCGIISSGNNATGASGPLWDGFHACDGTAQTVYMNAGASGQTLGTQSDPDGSIGGSLNHVGLGAGGTIQILTEGSTPIGNITGGYLIGHAGKFAATGSNSFPDYDDDDGGETAPGNVNLTIKGVASGTRTILRSSQASPFFELRNTATYVMLVGIDWDITAGSGASLISTVSDNNLGASVEHSVAVDKCVLQLASATVDDHKALNLGYDAETVRMRWNVLKVRTGRFGFAFLHLNPTFTFEDVECWRNVVLDGDVRRVWYCQDGPAGGDTWKFDHNTYYNMESGTRTVSLLEIADGADVAGTITHKNCIMYSDGANPTEYGTRITANPGSVSGVVEAHHNGYFGITNPRGTGVTDNGNEIEGVDPEFENTAATYTWDQSAASPAISVPRDLRPTADEYTDAADDTFNGIALDFGALDEVEVDVSGPVVYRTGLERVLLLTGSLSSYELYETVSKTVKIVSEHFDNGPPNRLIHPARFQLKYVPTAGDNIRLSWRTDRNVTHGVTIDLNPYSYSTFVKLAEDGDFYVYEDEMPSDPGKTLEITISTSSEVENQILGLNVSAKFSDSAAYVGGRA